MSALREDAFLGGKLRIQQPVQGYRAGADPVLLAASVPAKRGDSVLELGCGVGTGMLCLMARIGNLSLTGLERDPIMARIAAQNVAANGFDAEIIQGDIAALPPPLKERGFDHVFFNPPFFDRGTGSASPNPAREAGRGDDAVSTWCDTALRRLRPGGTLSLIQRTERLPDILAALAKRVGDCRVLPLQPREGRACKLFILQCRKGAKGPFSLLSPMVLHKGTHHEADEDSYTPDASQVLRHGAATLLAH